MTRNEQIVAALNCVSRHDVFGCHLDRIVRKSLAFADSAVIHPGQAIQMLETRIRVQAIELDKAKEALRQIREAAYEEAKEALLQGVGG